MIQDKDLSPRTFLSATVVILAIALGFRLWHLDALPVPVFDEVYFVKFAAQYLDGKPQSEGHPPLGKYFIALGMILFGRNAFGDRLMQVFFGSLVPVLLIGLVYLLTDRRSVAILAGLFLLLDGLFLVESRLSLLNVFLVELGLASQIFFLAGLRHSGFRRTIFLGCSGILLGASAAVKWNGLGFLLMVVLLIGLVWFVAISFPQNLKQLGILANITSLHWWQYLLSFVVMPVLIYTIQWIPHLMMNELRFLEENFWQNFLQDFWQNFWIEQQHIIHWHNSIPALSASQPPHPYCSPWWSWAVMARPVNYFFQITGDTNSEIAVDIHALGNPILWWFSTAAILGISVWGLRNFTGVTTYLLVGYGANYLPWAIAGRCVFAYHYMSALVFSIIGLALITDLLLQKKFLGGRSLGIFIIMTVVISYFFFLPIWLGLPLSSSGFYQRMWFMPNGGTGFNWL